MDREELGWLKAKLVSKCQYFATQHDMRFEYIDWRFGLCGMACGEMVTFETDLGHVVPRVPPSALEEAVDIWLRNTAEGIQRARSVDEVLGMASLNKLLEAARSKADQRIKWGTGLYVELVPYLDRCIELDKRIEAERRAMAWDDDDDEGDDDGQAS